MRRSDVPLGAGQDHDGKDVRMPDATRLAAGHPSVAAALQDLSKERVPAVVELLCIRSGEAVGLVVPVMTTIDELALLMDDLDAAAFDAHDDAEGGGGSYEDYTAAFRKARAAAALLHARRTPSTRLSMRSTATRRLRSRY